MPLREVPTEASFPALEREVLARWIRDRTFERSIEARRGGPEYVFYDGPPFATGLPHYGHILTSYIKDVVPRYFTMRGYHVPRRWGWDCHGLPVEHEIERALGLRSRADVIAYGVGRFNEACRASVLRYADEWRRIIGRLGRWVDFDHDYKTMDASYTETVVWIWKTLHDRGPIYEGDKVVAYCTRCQTTLSNFETKLDDAFRPRRDPALTVAFRLADAPGEEILAWTTTPWTLPSNVALAVGPSSCTSASGAAASGRGSPRRRSSATRKSSTAGRPSAPPAARSSSGGRTTRSCPTSPARRARSACSAPTS